MKSLEISLLAEGVFHRYGYDFRDYIPTYLESRIHTFVRSENLPTVSALQERVLHDPACVERFVEALTVNVSTMFRDPGFYAAFRKKVVPFLKTYPFVRIWLAGCGGGEEVYSLAILLQEEGLLDRTLLYATDLSERVIRQAKSAIFPLSRMKEFEGNYLKSGGNRSFSDYYTADSDNGVFSSSLRSRMAFARHNLVTDGSFNEFNVIVCRNVLVYFNNSLQDKVHRLFHASLGMFGVLSIGKKESLKYTSTESSYEELDQEEKLYRKVR